ncbi:uncharacterized protein CDV56_108702 [Aspergillus thermomutatus]|uniref:Myb-like domain-containing protein n=1 Tax=Aspergillus thermomutatus TaxID=41047 RepID=A0A397HFE3_ASPTH|nr:uncharacterized protein CDV56_108702 [Aspergillus thermomutatus]RHZ60748.1 hypothetical protein CDV56_108702 [Aspergillus thermomutatus]
MNRQISYNGPLVTSSFPARESHICTVPFPRTFPPCNSISSLPSGPLNHPLPPKPPTAKYFFHAYTPPDRDLVTTPDSTASQRNDRGECVPVNNEPEFPSNYQIGVLGSPMAENIISLPSEGTIQELGSDGEMTSSFSGDIADPPRPDAFLLAQNHDPCGRKLSVSPQCADVGICHADANPASEAPEAPPRTCECSGGDSISDNDGNGLLRRCMLYEGEEGLLDIPRSKAQPSFGQVAETSPRQPSSQVAEHATLSSMCIEVESARSKPTNRKRPAVAALETDGKASGPRTRARARAEASEASSSLPTPRSARPYSAAEDGALQKLVASGLAWDEIEKEFCLRFAKRTLRSLQMRWSRTQKLTAPWTRCSKRKKSSRP